MAAFEQEGEDCRAAGLGAAECLAGLVGERLGRTWGYAFDKGTQSFQVVRRGAGGVPLPLYDHPSWFDLPNACPSCPDTIPVVDKYIHKYARFCGSPGYAHAAGSRYMVVMASASRGLPPNEDFEVNRVYLVDIADPQRPVFHDLIELVERLEGAAIGDYGGVFADCSGWFPSYVPPVTPSAEAADLVSGPMAL